MSEFTLTEKQDKGSNLDQPATAFFGDQPEASADFGPHIAAKFLHQVYVNFSGRVCKL